MAEFPLTGGCNCGAVRYEVTEPPATVTYCHCTRCQRRTGTAASPSAVTAPGTFHVTAGEERMKFWKPDDGAEKWFCGDCGSALFAHGPGENEWFAVRVGTLDGDHGIRPDAHAFVASAASWEALPDDGLPRFAGRRPAH
jgi:hypothetical protein